MQVDFRLLFLLQNKKTNQITMGCCNTREKRYRKREREKKGAKEKKQ